MRLCVSGWKATAAVEAVAGAPAAPGPPTTPVTPAAARTGVFLAVTARTKERWRIIYLC